MSDFYFKPFSAFSLFSGRKKNRPPSPCPLRPASSAHLPPPSLMSPRHDSSRPVPNSRPPGQGRVLSLLCLNGCLCFFFLITHRKNCDRNQTLRAVVLFERTGAMSHHHHAQVWSNPECVHYVTYEQFFRVKIETLRKVHACGLAGVIMNWLWVQEFKMGPREMKSQSEVKPPWKADTVGQGWDRLREWGQFLYEGTEGKTTEPDLGTMAYPHPGNCAAHGCYGYRCHEGWLWNVTKASGSLVQPTLPPT